MMSLQKQIIKQINTLTEMLIKTSFSIKENYVSNSANDICWSGYKDIAFTLKKRPYDEIYSQCVAEGAYNFILLDNALIQLMYRTQDDKIISHRLAYLPHPNFLNLQENPEDFEELQYGNELFTDIMEKKVISIPLRFDFDISDEKHLDIDHPRSHVTLGNYKNCRIPASRPISPNRFVLFILRSFYFDRFKEHFKNEDFLCQLNLDDSISDTERVHIHLIT